ncbi:hypothetical protein BDW66DRAFT_4277 [Aspergillus desertorum]
MEVYDTFFFLHTVLHIHHRRSGHIQTTGMSVCNRFVVLAWIAQLHGDFAPGSRLSSGLSSRYQAQSWLNRIPWMTLAHRRLRYKQPFQAGTQKRAAGIGLSSCLFSVPTGLVLVLLAVDFFVSL